MLEALTAHASHIGGRRRNEDACAYWLSDAGCCWCVADGAGGHGGGDVAARLVVDHVLQGFSACPEVSVDSAARLIRTAHEEVMRAKQVHGADDMHATCALLLLDRQKQLAVWGHVGDSRVYLFREGLLVFQTRDHSLVQNMIDAGYGNTEMIRTHPQRSLLTSAIGNAGELELSIAAEPLPVQAGDQFLLCSDGWWEYVREDTMQLKLADSADVDIWLSSMADLIACDGKPNHDNYTAIAVSLAAALPAS